jgi:hypothetical protein
VYQVYLDKTVIYPKARWASFFGIVALYMVRVYYLEGFYIVTYGLGIYLLNLFIGFLTPAIDPEEAAFAGDEDLSLPTHTSDEFRPFTRKLPEFQFWFWGTRAVLTSTAMTFFAVFDLPVFWPILLVYFFFLFVLTMKQQILHMIKYKYVPWSSGKQSYAKVRI